MLAIIKLLTAVAACGAVVTAQGRQAPSDPPVARPSRIVPAGPATWDVIDRRGPTVDYELGSEGGWYYWPPVLQWRFIDSVHWATTDPIVEVDIYPPYSGSTTNVEAFFLQIPVTNPVPLVDRGMVIGFHGSSLSPGQIFGVTGGNTVLPQYCTAKGWYLLAPTGLHASNMAAVPSQKALEVSLALIYGLLPFNVEKVYHLGFSMGGLNATSFAFRHQDPYAIRTAGIIYHTGTTDIVRDYNEAPAFAKATIWENPLVFGASPTADPFAYDRVNPARFSASGVGFLEEHFQLDALRHTPIYLHWNTNDPTKYDGWSAELETELLAKGFNVKSVQATTATPAHSIFTLDFLDALDWVTQWTAGPLPTSAEIYADRPARYLWSEMLTDPAPHVARYTVTIDELANSFAVEDTHWVQVLAFDLPLMNLDPSQTIAVELEPGDATPVTFVLKGYPAAPSSVLVDGAPPVAWSYDAMIGATSVTPAVTASGVVIEIVP